jgi:hypothetical protein
VSSLLAALDGALAAQGDVEKIKLRRVVGTTNQIFVDSPDIPARVNSPTSQDLIAGIQQDELICIFSPTQIIQAQWPGGQPPTVTDDPRIPSKNRGDKAFVRGRWRAVQWGQGFYPGGDLVRIEMRVMG